MSAAKQPLIDAIVRFGKVDAQAAYRLLGSCATQGLTYYWSITPPAVAKPACQDQVNRITAAARSILTPTGFTAPTPQPERSVRAALLDSLPTRAGGAGLIPATTTQPCAFISTVQTVLYHPVMALARHALAPDLQDALDALKDALICDDLHSVQAVARVIPATTAGFLDVDSSDSQQQPPKWRRVQSVLTSAVAGVTRTILLARCDPATNTPTPATTSTDMQQASLIMRRSQQSRILQAPLHHADNRIPTLDFVFFWRYYTTRPRLLRPGRPTAFLPPPLEPTPPDAATQQRRAADPNWAPILAEICSLAHTHAKPLSPTADHAIGCQSTYGARYRAHSMLMRCIAKASRAAGCTADHEPSTSALLQQEFTETEIRSLCPKVHNGASRLRSKAIYDALTHLASLPADDPTAARLLETIKKIIADTPAKTKGVRLDLALTLPDGQEIWIDFAGVHPTTLHARSRIDAWLRTTQLADFVSSGAAANNPASRVPSPAVVFTVDMKRKRYELLMQLAQHQALAGKRTNTPTLSAAVVTHLGELSPDFINLIEKITAAAAAGYRPGPLNNGAPRKTFTARFRTRLKDSIMVANARGFGRALRSAGNPMPGWVSSPEDDLHLPSWDSHSY